MSLPACCYPAPSAPTLDKPKPSGLFRFTVIWFHFSAASAISCGKTTSLHGVDMLTATYAIVNLSVEQEKSCTLISQIQQFCRNRSEGLNNINLPDLKSVAKQLSQFDESCHRRKIEMNVIPAIRNARNAWRRRPAGRTGITECARRQHTYIFEGATITEYRSMDGPVRWIVLPNGTVPAGSAEKTGKKDAIFALAKRLLLSEHWFAIGVQFFSIDAQNHYTNNSGMQCNMLGLS